MATDTTLANVEKKIHVRYEGNSYEYLFVNLDISDEPQDSEVLEVARMALANELGDEVSLAEFVVEAYSENGLWDVHPQAKFGE